MRFDDRLETALRQADGNDNGVAAKWQQLVDILAQNPNDFDLEYVASGLLKGAAILAMVVPPTNAEQCVKSLGRTYQICAIGACSCRVMFPPVAVGGHRRCKAGRRAMGRHRPALAGARARFPAKSAQIWGR